MTAEQLQTITDLFRVRGKMGAKDAAFLDQCGTIRNANTSVRISDDASSRLTELATRYQKQIQKAKRESYSLQPSGVIDEPRPRIMKAMALQDDAPKNPVPWLSLVEYSIKTIETRRNWMNRSHRGDTLFTASATSRTPNAGLAVCVANVVDIVRMTKAHEEAANIAVFDHAWALILEDLRWLSRKFPVKGSLGVFEVEVPDDVEFVTPTAEQLAAQNLPDYLKRFLINNAS